VTSRTGAIVAALAAVVLAAPAVARAGVNADRARASYARLGAIVGHRALRAWPFSQLVAAAVAVAELPGATRAERLSAAARIKQLERYRDVHGYHAERGGDVYVDDNEWIALDQLDWRDASGDPAMLARATRTFGLVVHQWDAGRRDPCPGGVYWTEATRNRDRNTVTTAAGALLGLRLYALERRPALLWWSTRMLAWLDTCLRGPRGLYFDHLGADGTVDRTLWSYNQGAVVGADVLLYRLTGDADALTNAEDVAQASLPYLAPGVNEPPEFAAILARHLLELAALDGDTSLRDAVHAWADATWSHARGAPLAQAALVQVYALLARAGP
jgi:hypothetical protein